MTKEKILIIFGKHQFIAEEDDEIEFQTGDPILVLEKDEAYNDGWWKGRTLNGNEGLFPVNFTTPENIFNVNLEGLFGYHSDTSILMTETKEIMNTNTTTMTTHSNPSVLSQGEKNFENFSSSSFSPNEDQDNAMNRLSYPPSQNESLKFKSYTKKEPSQNTPPYVDDINRLSMGSTINESQNRRSPTSTIGSVSSLRAFSSPKLIPRSYGDVDRTNMVEPNTIKSLGSSSSSMNDNGARFSLKMNPIPSFTSIASANTNNNNNNNDTNNQRKPQSWDNIEVCEWLVKIHFEKLVDSFKERNINGSTLLNLNLSKLRELGVHSLTERIDLLHEILSLKEEFSDVKRTFTLHSEGSPNSSDEFENFNDKEAPRKFTSRKNENNNNKIDQNGEDHRIKPRLLKEPSAFSISEYYHGNEDNSNEDGDLVESEENIPRIDSLPRNKNYMAPTTTTSTNNNNNNNDNNNNNNPMNSSNNNTNNNNSNESRLGSPFDYKRMMMTSSGNHHDQPPVNSLMNTDNNTLTRMRSLSLQNNLNNMNNNPKFTGERKFSSPYNGNSYPMSPNQSNFKRSASLSFSGSTRYSQSPLTFKDVDRQGWLFFRLNDEKLWKKRWVVLIDNRLFILKSPEMDNGAGANSPMGNMNKTPKVLIFIDLNPKNKVLPDNDDNRRENNFVLIDQRVGVIHLAAESQLSMVTWINVLVRSSTNTKRKPLPLIPLKNAGRQAREPLLISQKGIPKSTLERLKHGSTHSSVLGGGDNGAGDSMNLINNSKETKYSKNGMNGMNGGLNGMMYGGLNGMGKMNEGSGVGMISTEMNGVNDMNSYHSVNSINSTTSLNDHHSKNESFIDYEGGILSPFLKNGSHSAAKKKTASIMSSTLPANLPTSPTQTVAAATNGWYRAPAKSATDFSNYRTCQHVTPELKLQLQKSNKFGIKIPPTQDKIKTNNGHSLVKEKTSAEIGNYGNLNINLATTNEIMKNNLINPNSNASAIELMERRGLGSLVSTNSSKSKYKVKNGTVNGIFW